MYLLKLIKITISLSIIFSLTACQKPKPNVDSTNPNYSPQSNPQITSKAVRVGILSIDSGISVNERYQPLLNYLEQIIGRPFELVTLSQESQFTEVKASNLDFIINNPLAAVQIRRLYDTQLLVTHSRPKTGTLLSGLIVVDHDSNINTINNLRGKRAACVDFETAAAGCVFQIYHLQQKGINPFKDFSSFIENKSQDNIVLAVLNGTLDVGFIRTGQLEKMLENGLINSTNELKIIDRANDKFPYPHTTSLYPEWPIAALKNTDPKLAQDVKEALLNIPAQHPALSAAKVDRFTPIENYNQLDQLIETLKLKSWDVE
jgi:two-component system, LuxR family, sensor histidine kinase TtrS